MPQFDYFYAHSKNVETRIVRTEVQGVEGV